MPRIPAKIVINAPQPPRVVERPERKAEKSDAELEAAAKAERRAELQGRKAQLEQREAKALEAKKRLQDSVDLMKPRMQPAKFARHPVHRMLARVELERTRLERGKASVNAKLDADQ